MGTLAGVSGFVDGVPDGVDSGANHESNGVIVCYVETFISLIPEEALP